VLHFYFFDNKNHFMAKKAGRNRALPASPSSLFIFCTRLLLQ
jgi:hypothetical protein